MNREREMRSFTFEVRADKNEEHGAHLTGRPIVFGEAQDMGWYTEIVDKNALNEADLRDVRFLVNHNVDMIPLARSRNNNENSTMQFTVGEDGMDIRVDLDTENNADARALYSAVSRGDISGMSFMFTVSADEWTDQESDHPTRTIKAFDKVFEVSAVTWPAYAATFIEARGIGEAPEGARRSLESARAKAKEERDRINLIKLLTEV